MTLAARDTALRELMDDPACDPVRLDATLRRFDLVNRLVSGWGTVYRTRLRSYLRGLERPARVLDLGCGGGDLVRRLAAATARDGLAVTVVGADPEVDAYYDRVVRHGPDAFVEYSEGYAGFRDAMTRKLFREINGLVVGLR